MEGHVVTPEGLVLFERVFQPDTKYGTTFKITLAFPKATTNLQEMVDFVNTAILGKWGANPPANLELPFKDGDNPGIPASGKDPTPFNQKYPIVQGHWYVEFRTNTQPGVCDGNRGNAWITLDEMRKNPAFGFKAGDYARVQCSAGAYDIGDPIVRLHFNLVQKTREGEALAAGGGPTDPNVAFGPAPGQQAAPAPYSPPIQQQPTMQQMTQGTPAGQPISNQYQPTAPQPTYPQGTQPQANAPQQLANTIPGNPQGYPPF